MQKEILFPTFENHTQVYTAIAIWLVSKNVFGIFFKNIILVLVKSMYVPMYSNVITISNASYMYNVFDSLGGGDAYQNPSYGDVAGSECS